MRRIVIPERTNWKKKVEQAGFTYHSEGGKYWDESACYEFQESEAAEIKRVTNRLWVMCLKALRHVIDKKLYDRFYIPPFFEKYLEDCWHHGRPSLYGRFDLVYKEGKIKMLEFNGDTPASLMESAMVQEDWLHDCYPGKRQINQITKKLIAVWTKLSRQFRGETVYFSCLRTGAEDIGTTEFIMTTARACGIKTKFIYIDEIGWDAKHHVFVDLENEVVRNIYKLFPYEWMVHSDFGENLVKDKSEAIWIEPAWKMIVSSKALLPLLWELFPGDENLLECYYEKKEMISYAKKPFLCRQGEQVELVKDGKAMEEKGVVPDDHCIYQELFELPDFDGNRPVIGSWIVGNEATGIGIRESKNYITDKDSRFVPHYIE